MELLDMDLKQLEYFRHVAEEGPFTASLLDGAKMVQLAEACHLSHAERRWVTLDPLRL